jgi:hypothetical protein
MAPPSSKPAASNSPTAIGTLSLLEVSFAAWDLTRVHLVDPHTGTVLCRLFPQDKAANASGLRRNLQPVTAEPVTPPPPPARGNRTAAGENDRPPGRDRTAAGLPPQGRRLSASLATQRDVTVGVISRPQANTADFYREMGELFGVELRPHNRYGGAKVLRQRWQVRIPVDRDH